MQFIYHYPETTGTDGDMLDSGRIDVVAREAEQAGFDAFALTEHPIPGARWLHAGGHQSLDPFVALSFAAAATGRIRLLTHLVVAPYRNPMLLAKQAATVDKLSGGRFILGLGTGYHKTEFRALGVDMDERNHLFDEALDVMPLHWSGQPFSYQGRHFEAREVIARPRPVQSPIPIWIGGNSKLTRRRVAQRAQGWMPMLGPKELSVTTRTPAITSLEELVPYIAEVRDTAEAVGRTDRLDFLYSHSVGDPALNAERHRHAFADIEQAGVTWVVISGDTHEEAATVDFIRAFGATYLS